MTTKIITTACPRDCYEGCEIQATVVNGKLTRLTGGTENQYTNGIICQRVRKYQERVYAPERITSPMKKVDGKWVNISWDEAITLAANALKKTIEKYGQLSILSYQSAGSMSALKILNHRFFNLLGGVTTTWGSLCGGASSAARMKCTGIQAIQDPLDLKNAKGVILWGRNPIHTSIHLLPIFNELREKNVPIVMIDPIYSDTAKFVDKVYQPRPGGDGFLAIAIAKKMLGTDAVNKKFIKNHTDDFDKFTLLLRDYDLDFCIKQSGLTETEIDELVRLYSLIKPCAIIHGFGVQRYVDGNEIVELIHALGAMTGNISLSGGGVSHSTDEWRFFDTSLELNEQAKFKRRITKSLLGIDILREVNPPIKVAFVQLANPISQTPNSPSVISAFEQMDYVILVDSFLTDTSDYADLFLPTTTFVEEEDVLGSYGHQYLTYMNQIIPPLGQSKTDLEILQLLAVKMGISGMEGSVEEWLDKLLAPVHKDGINQKTLKAAGTLRSAEKAIPYENGQFYTDNGKFKFIRKYDAYIYNEKEYPLFFMTVAGPKSHNSQLLEKYQEEAVEAIVNPNNISLSNLKNGDMVLLKSRVGTMEVKIKLDENQRKDTVLLYRGGWLKKGWGPNQITEPLMSREGGGAAYYSTKVKMVRH